MQVAAIILAAGASTRFGSPKHEVRIGGRTMLEHVAAAASEAGLTPLLALVPPGSELPGGVLAVINDAPEQGISRSVRLGLSAVPPEADGAVLLLGDEPLMTSEAIVELLVAAGPGAPVAATQAGQRLGPPVFLRRDRFGLADAATGDEGLGRTLRAQPDIVVVEAGREPMDIDTPAQLDALAPPCPGCGARFFASIEGPTHEYMLSSPGCWAAFTELAAREFGDPAYGALHRHVVDAYAVQHPGHGDRRARQSVAVHLIGLCHWLEHGLTAAALTPITQRLTGEPREWPFLAPPKAYTVTAVDVLAATSRSAHVSLVRAWAESVWGAWSTHHELVRAWAREVLR